MLTFSEMFDDLENEEAFEDELEFENPGQNLTKESRRIFGFGSKVKKSMLFSYKKSLKVFRLKAAILGL